MGGGVKHRRKQIGDAFADAGSAFHDELPALVDGAGDGLEHLGLLGPVFKPGKSAGKYALGRQKILDLLFGEFAPYRVACLVTGVAGQPPGQAIEVQTIESDGPGSPGRRVSSRGMRHERFEQVRNRAVGGSSSAGDERNFRRRVRSPQSQQLVEHQRGGFRVGHGAVGLVMLEVQMPGESAQVVFRQAGQEYRRQVPGVVAAVGQVETMG